MITSPKISVVIPTKYAGKSIYATIDTVLSQSYHNYELIISDASYSSELAKVITNKNNFRIRYVNPQKNLSFSDDWNSALEASTGDYVTFIGDDDALLPTALEFFVTALLKTKISAFVWNKINYNWPNHLLPNQRNIMVGESSPILYTVSAAKALRLASKFRLGYAKLPCIYNSIVSRQIIENIRELSPGNRFFSGVIPDVYSSVAIAASIDKYIYAMFPLSVNGAAKYSSGVKQGLPNLSEDLKKTIPDVLSSGNRYHPDIGPFSSSVASIVMGEYLIAKSNLKKFYFPEPNWRNYIKYMIREAKSSNQADLILTAARHTIRRRGIRLSVPDCMPHSGNDIVYYSNSHFQGRLALDDSVVSDVRDAAKLFGCLVPREFAINDRLVTYTIAKVFLKDIANKLVRLYQLLLVKY
jgi:glycosyltransferase involved in cell wall biosynthesis